MIFHEAKKNGVLINQKIFVLKRLHNYKYYS